MMFQ
jgi:hypothetical protein